MGDKLGDASRGTATTGGRGGGRSPPRRALRTKLPRRARRATFICQARLRWGLPVAAEKARAPGSRCGASEQGRCLSHIVPVGRPAHQIADDKKMGPRGQRLGVVPAAWGDSSSSRGGGEAGRGKWGRPCTQPARGSRAEWLVRRVIVHRPIERPAERTTAVQATRRHATLLASPTSHHSRRPGRWPA